MGSLTRVSRGGVLAAGAAVAVLATLTAACDGGADDEPTAGGGPTPAALSAARAAVVMPESPRPQRWLYWLSDVDLDRAAAVGAPVAVIDYSRDGTQEGAFTADEIGRLRAAMPDPALVIAYLSIGEAEDYRFYWEESRAGGKPAWLESENPDWPGNFKVRYWDPDWQRLVFGAPGSYLDRILAAGFDGAYLDIIDAYEHFADRGRVSAEEEMVEFVRAIAGYARSRRPGFLVFPQNAPELGARPEYLAVVDGIGVEGVYFGYEEQDLATDPVVTAELERALKRFVDAGKLVLAVDYADSAENVAEAYRRAREQGFVPTVTDVDLAGPPLPEPAR